MSYRILKTAWALAVCLPTLALAQQAPAADAHREGSWELSAGAGLLSVDGALRGFLTQTYVGPRFTNTASPGRLAPTAVARVGYNFTRNLGFSLAGGAAVGSGVTYLTPEAAVTYTWNLNARTSPFLLGGLQLTRIAGQSSRVTHSTWGAHVGLGVRHMISENLALRLDGRIRLERFKDLYFNKTAYNDVVTLGISYFLGGRRPAAPTAAAPCPRCPLARVDTIVRFRRDTLVRARTDTVRVAFVDTVRIAEASPDQLVLRVQFATDSTALLRKSRPVLDTIAMAIIATPNSRWEVQGHTDNVGSPEHNRTLAQGRAQAVVDYLVTRGVARSILEATGVGDTRPVFTNSSPYGRAQNRRVQLRRIPPPPTGPPVR